MFHLKRIIPIIFPAVFPVIFPLIFLVTLCFANDSAAATLIEVQSGPASRTQIMIDGHQSRIGMGEHQGYVLIDYQKQTMFSVDHEQKQILDMSGDLPSTGGRSAPRIKIELEAGGNGPTITGFSTKVFRLRANGKNCGTLFGSKAAMQTPGIARLFDSMKAMVEKQRAALGGYASMINICTRANMSFAFLGDRLGVPLRMLDNRGNIVSEVKSITTSATLPADAFTLPQGYKMVSIAGQMNQAGQSIRQSQRQVPDRPQMINQVQHSGRMLPEAMEQMRRYREMMQQAN